jgi:hypothetical protein
MPGIAAILEVTYEDIVPFDERSIACLPALSD